MKILRCVTVLALLILSATIAKADGVTDPKFVVIGGGHSQQLTSPNDENFVINYSAGQTDPLPVSPCGFNYGTSSNTCALYDFINNSGVTWTGIQFEITGATGNIQNALLDEFHPGGFAADNTLDPYFTGSSATVNDAGDVVLSFFGTDETHPGILPATACNTDGCSGPGFFLPNSDIFVPLYDFGILVDVTGATTQGDSFAARGSATVPEPSSIFLLLAGSAMLGLFLNKRA
jgi:hypothetical protein